MTVVVSDPECVQLGADAQALSGAHSSHLSPLEALGVSMAGEEAYTAFHP
jgi:hypothetical protein